DKLARRVVVHGSSAQIHFKFSINHPINAGCNRIVDLLSLFHTAFFEDVRFISSTVVYHYKKLTILITKFMRNLKMPILIYTGKIFNLSTSKLLANFRIFNRFPTIRTTHKESCIKFSKLFGHPKFFYRQFIKKFLKKKNQKFQWSINNSKIFENLTLGMFLQDSRMKIEFEHFSEMVCADATYKLIDLKIPLYVLLVEGGVARVK
ncbi:zinc finger SWIM domain-containing protein 3-like, partial [Aphis craccivora]